jgi:hypothetical protein
MKYKTSIKQTKIVNQLSVARYSELDTVPFKPLSFVGSSIGRIIQLTGINKRSAAALTEFRKKYKDKELLQIPFHSYFDNENGDRLKRSLLYQNDKRTIITNVEVRYGKIMSDSRFTLRVFFSGDTAHSPLLASIKVLWKGAPFVVEKIISKGLAKKGYADIEFTKEQALPVGLVVFYVRLYNSVASQSSFRLTCYVLPSNPFNLSLSPNGNFVTGTFSARAVKQSGNYVTAINVTLSNGNSFAVNMNNSFTWKFWDGGVGGSLVESGTGNFGVNIQVPSFGTWGGWISFSSPPGSGIFNKFNGKEDMTIEIIMTRSDGSSVSGTITARTMFRYGVNVTEVSPRDFTGQQYNDLQSAILVTRAIYERVDVSFNIDNRYIPDASVGGYEIIDSFGEFHDLLNDWSGPDTNNNIDAFICQVAIPTSSGTADGVDGSIPGPTSHHGGDSGVVANKSGYVDSSGQPRLSVDYLGMLIGHELGHYLGLSHIDSANNIMLWNSGTYDTILTYDQYRMIIRHGWMSID